MRETGRLWLEPEGEEHADLLAHRRCAGGDDESAQDTVQVAREDHQRDPVLRRALLERLHPRGVNARFK